MNPVRRKLLAIRTGAMGDVCLLVPLMRALQDFFSIDWLVCERHAAVVRSFPELTCRLFESSADPRAPSPFSEELVQRLQSESYDLCIDFSHWPSTAELVLRLNAIPIRATLHDPLQDALLDLNPLGAKIYEPFNRLVEAAPSLHQIEKWRLLIEAVCHVSLKVCWPISERPSPAKTLRIFIQVHASKKSKRWPARYFASVLRSLARQRPVHCYVSAFPERYAKRLEWLLPFSGCRVERIPFERNLQALKDCLQTVDLALGCDTGPLHFAALLGVPTIVVYGPYPASEFHPVGTTLSVSPSRAALPASTVKRAAVKAALERLVADLDSPKRSDFSASRV